MHESVKPNVKEWKEFQGIEVATCTLNEGQKPIDKIKLREFKSQDVPPFPEISEILTR